MAKKLLFDSNRSEIDQYFEDQASFLIQKQKLDRIDNFNGYFDFLNNEYSCQVFFDGLLFKSVTYAYQAARSTQRHIREKISLADTPVELYEIATKIEDPENWNSNRVRMMEAIVRDKFRRNKDLRERLKATGERELYNTFSDATTSNLFWGIVEGKGQNQLGRLLEQIRNDCFQNMELEKWIYMVFLLEENKHFLPKITLKVMKNNEVIEKIELKDKPFFLFGTLKTNDVVLAHQSISRNHAVLIIEQNMGASLIDLQSKSGTIVDNVRLEHHMPYRLKQESKIQFAVSSRQYVVEFDYSMVELNFEIKKKALEKDKMIYEKLQEAGVSKEILLASLGLVAEDTIFVSNLPENIGEKELKDFFKEYGKIRDLKLPFDKKTGRIKRICFVTYENEKDAKNSLSSDGKMLKDKRLRVNLAEKKSSDQLLLEKLEGKSKNEVLKSIEKYEKMVKREFDEKFNPKKKEKVVVSKDNEEVKKTEKVRETEKVKEKEKFKEKVKEKEKDKEKDKENEKNKGKGKEREISKERNNFRKNKSKEKLKERSRSRSHSKKKEKKNKDKD